MSFIQNEKNANKYYELFERNMKEVEINFYIKINKFFWIEHQEMLYLSDINYIENSYPAQKPINFFSQILVKKYNFLQKFIQSSRLQKIPRGFGKS